jgi:hypothetical protein
MPPESQTKKTHIVSSRLLSTQADERPYLQNPRSSLPFDMQKFFTYTAAIQREVLILKTERRVS